MKEWRFIEIGVVVLLLIVFIVVLPGCRTAPRDAESLTQEPTKTKFCVRVRDLPRCSGGAFREIEYVKSTGKPGPDSCVWKSRCVSVFQ